MTRAEILTALNAAGLGHYCAQAEALLQPALTLQTLPTPDDALPVGASKMGGVPDLPHGTPWPCVEGEARPLHFLAQINFAETTAVWPHSALPKSGLLSVLYDAYETPDRGLEGFKILYNANTDNVKRYALPEPLQTLMKRKHIPGQFNSCAVQMTKTVPVGPLKRLEVADEHFETLMELAQEEEFGAHQMLGQPDYFYDGSLLDLAAATSGVNETEETNAPAESQGWLLLMQIDTDDNPGWGWGDGGKLYFHIHERDLAEHNFSNVLMEAQCG